MAIRKIPLKERSYLRDGVLAAEVDNSVPEDPEVSRFLDQIRRKLRTDRALHDQAGILHISALTMN
jgi:hypothetical protein